MPGSRQMRSSRCLMTRSPSIIACKKVVVPMEERKRTKVVTMRPGREVAQIKAGSVKKCQPRRKFLASPVVKVVSRPAPSVCAMLRQHQLPYLEGSQRSVTSHRLPKLPKVAPVAQVRVKRHQPNSQMTRQCGLRSMRHRRLMTWL